MLVEGHMDDGFTFSRAQEEESRSARVIRKCQSLFNRFNKYVIFTLDSPRPVLDVLVFLYSALSWHDCITTLMFHVFVLLLLLLLLPTSGKRVCKSTFVDTKYWKFSTEMLLEIFSLGCLAEFLT
jgi:hypothetical protein